MEEKVFVFISSDSVILNSEKHSKLLNFQKQGIREANPDIITRIVYDFLESIEFKYEEIILVLSEDYISIKEQIKYKNGVKKNQNAVKSDFQYSYISNPIESESLDFASYTDFVCNGDVYKNHKDLPKSQKYYQRNLHCSWQSVKLNEILELLLDKGIVISYVLPLNLFVVNNTSAEICISIYQNKSYISVVKNGVIRNSTVVSDGLMKIREDVSNKFNVSLKVAETLIKTYGYVFLPSKYVEYVVDIPIYDKIVQSIEFPDLSFCIRESAKSLITEIIGKLDKQLAYSDSRAIINASSQIRGLDKLLGLMTNKQLTNSRLGELTYSEMINAFNVIDKYDTFPVEEVTPEIEPVLVEEDQDVTSLSIKERLTGIVENSFRTLFVEAIV